ncbi:MAG: hypothetical protein HY810_06835 [Candidatus Omnitrophica bacterium]|nr:hypothetical protein [Candidatus Omnitrophota bacterium]
MKYKKSGYSVFLKLVSFAIIQAFLFSYCAGSVSAADVFSNTYLAPSVTLGEGTVRGAIIDFGSEDRGSLDDISAPEVLPMPYVVATLGPATRGNEKELIENGVNMVRIPLGHGTRERHQQTIDMIAQISEETGKEVGIMLDLSGFKLRIGALRGSSVVFKENATVMITNKDIEGDGTESLINVNYRHFIRDIAEQFKKGEKEREAAKTILLDAIEGMVELEVVEILDNTILRATVKKGGTVMGRKGIYAPGVKMKLPTLTEKDQYDIKFAAENSKRISSLALSFVRTAGDIRQVKEALNFFDAQYPGAKDLKIIAKIETREALENIDEIIQAADIIMIARKDLSIVLTPEELAYYQTLILEKCKQAGKPVILASRLLESMKLKEAAPTDKEVANIFEGVNYKSYGFMLSDETGIGKNPVQAVKKLKTLLEEGILLRDTYEARKAAWQKEKQAKEPSIDVIMVVGGTQDRADAYRNHFESLRGVVCRDDIPILYVATPTKFAEIGGLIGNGGAECNAMWTLNNQLPELAKQYTRLKGKSLSELRVAMIFAGGKGTRYTAGPSDGAKPLMPLALRLENGDQARAIDVVMLGSYVMGQRLKRSNRAGVLGLNGDGFLIADPELVEGIGLISWPVSMIEADEKYGVVVRQPDGKITSFREKPSMPEMIKFADELMIDANNREIRQVQANSASYIKSHSDKDKYSLFIQGYIEVANYLHARVDQGKKTYEVDNSSDLAIPLAIRAVQDLTEREKQRQSYIQSRSKGDKDREEFYSGLFEIVTKYFMDLYTALPAEGKTTLYVDYGDMGTWYGDIMRPNSFKTIAGYLGSVDSYVDSWAVMGEDAKTYRSFVSPLVKVGEKAVLYGAQLYPGSTVGAGTIVYNIKGEIQIGENMLIVMSPIRVNSERNAFIVFYLGREDNLKTAARKGVLFGKNAYELITSWKDHEGEPLFPGFNADTDLTKAAIWPVTDSSEIDMNLVSWMSQKGAWAPKEYVEALKFSFDKISSKADFPAILQRDSELAYRIDSAVLMASGVKVEKPNVFEEDMLELAGRGI